jgi:two-component sensor histidine kinase
MKLSDVARDVRGNPPLGWFVALFAFAMFLFLRWEFRADLAGLPFITFFSAIMVAGMFGGVLVGGVVLVLSFFAGWYLFIPPSFSFELTRTEDKIGLGFFAAAGLFQLYLIHVLNSAIDELYRSREHSQVLFKELQHRVANNLTFVAALLRQQYRVLENDSPAKKAISASESRLALMANIHRRLYDPAQIDQPVGDYLKELCDELIQASGAENIKAHVNAEKVVLELDRVMALAMIVSELVTNCLKHAFVARDEGTISLFLRSAGGSYYELTVEDDGCGMLDAKNENGGLGRSIIKGLLSQLRGEMSVKGETGTRVTVKFPRTAFG